MNSNARSSRADVRNPVLALPGIATLRALDPSTRAAIAGALREIQADARVHAIKCWKTHKAPMALYWKAVGVYAGHLARALVRRDDVGD
ncbi:hypothetical protein QP162_05940 [Sphingomonas aurantiaca]|uniref:hypothetical protein n=1 Tax=Sphingomonas aurantiaca TaxID=185949 RepID=UPI002FDFD59B